MIHHCSCVVIYVIGNDIGLESNYFSYALITDRKDEEEVRKEHINGIKDITVPCTTPAGKFTTSDFTFVFCS